MTAPASLDSLHFQTACLWEAAARKPGNVHPCASFHDAEFMQFALSGIIAGKVFDDAHGKSVGELVSKAIDATNTTIGTNTNLGILLLIAPLVLANEHAFQRNRLDQVLQALTIEDTQRAYHAIRVANPGGLGEVPKQDVRDEPTVTLLEAMKLAAERDMIARQYANGFADVFDFGVPAFTDAFAKFGCVEAAIIESQLRWLAAYPDSLIIRKRGIAAAEDVQRSAADVLRLGGITSSEGRAAGVALDQYLRSEGNALNPGTTADLITACLFVALRENTVKPSSPFHWDIPDWL